MQEGWISDSPADCGAPGYPGDEVAATAVSSSVTWPGSALPYPCTLDVDLQLDFASGPAWVPDSATIAGVSVAVDGC